MADLSGHSSWLLFSVFAIAPAWLAAGLAWIAHIAFDPSLGFGLRSPAGFQRA